jgi:hypothetical protein
MRATTRLAYESALRQVHRVRRAECPVRGSPDRQTNWSAALEVIHPQWGNVPRGGGSDGTEASGGMKTDQLKRLKELEVENARLRRAISELTLDKLVLKEAARGNF